MCFLQCHQQLDLITPYQIYFNPKLIFSDFQVRCCIIAGRAHTHTHTHTHTNHTRTLDVSFYTLPVLHGLHTRLPCTFPARHTYIVYMDTCLYIPIILCLKFNCGYILIILCIYSIQHNLNYSLPYIIVHTQVPAWGLSLCLNQANRPETQQLLLTKARFVVITIHYNDCVIV